jgi:sulfur relay (sulfurtransferase) DsrC/TusE family protein
MIDNNLVCKLNGLVDNIESRKPYYLEIEDWLQEMVDLMTEDSDTTIIFFEECNSSHTQIISWLSPFFDDIYCKFPSSKMADTMKSLVDKFPEISYLANEVELALRQKSQNNRNVG